MTRDPRFRMYSRGRVIEVGWHEDPATPTEVEGGRRSTRLAAVGLGLIALVALVAWAWVVLSNGGSRSR